MASMYKFVLAVIMIVILIFLWIPFNEVLKESGGIVDAFNNATTDAGIIQYNNTGGMIFYYSLFIIIIILLIWVVKDEQGSTGYE